MALRICFIGDSITNGYGDPEYNGWPAYLSAAARHGGTDITAYKPISPLIIWACDPPPMSWSSPIVSRGGPRNGNQETQAGRDRDEASPG